VEGLVWEKTFRLRGFEDGKSVQQTSDGGYVVAGNTATDNGWDILLLKADADGTRVWSRTFGGELADYGCCARQTSDGGYIVVGSTMYGTSWEDAYGHGGGQVWLLKTDAEGNEMWNRIFWGDAGGTGYSVEQTADGGYVLVGGTGVDAGAYVLGCGTGLDVWLIKTDSDGNQIWTAAYGGAESETGYCVQQVHDGGYVLIGETCSYGSGESDAWMLRIDAGGNELWNKTFGGTGLDSGRFIQQTSDGGYVFVGQTSSFGAQVSHIWLVKTDADGNELWNKTFGAGFWASGNCVRETIDGGYVVTGFVEGSSAEGYGADVAVIKVDPSGDVLWDLAFGGPEMDIGGEVVQIADGSYVLTGMTSNKLSGSDSMSCSNMDRTTEQSLFLIKIADQQ